MTLKDIFKPRMQGRSNVSRDVPTVEEVETLRNDAAEGNTEGVRAFFQRYASDFATDRGTNGLSPLRLAVLREQMETVAILKDVITRGKSNVSLQMA